MNKLLTSIICLAMLCPSVAMAKKKKNPKEKDMAAYLMVYHRDEDHGLHAAISHDGYTFTALNGGMPIIAGDTIADQRGIRDPHIFRGPDGAFYISMTDLHIYAKQKGYRDTEWERDGKKFGWGNNRGLVLAKSWDMIHFTHTNARFDNMQGWENVGCVWAPELVYEKATKRLMLYFTMRHGVEPNKLYYSYVNNDFNKIETTPELLYVYPKEGVNAIDGDITYAQGKYHLFYVAHDGTAGIKQAVSSTVNKGYVYDDKWIDYEKGGCEAPNVWKRIGENKWVLMYDIYSRRPHNFGFVETSDFKTFKHLGRFNEGVMKTTNFTSPKHGAVIQITAEEAKCMEEYWGSKNVKIPGAVGMLDAVLSKPQLKAGEKCPLTIIMHGFNGNKNADLLLQIADSLKQKGIATLMFDFNGHGHSDGDFQHMTIVNEIQDAKAVYHYAKSLPFVSEIAFVGHSQGGVVASMTAGELGKDSVNGLVLLAPAAVLRDDVLRGNTFGAMYDPYNAPDYVTIGKLHLGKDYINTTRELPIYETAAKYVGPVYILHGTHDRVVPYTYGERYNQVLKNSKMDLLQGFDHAFGQDIPRLASLTSNYLRQVLK